MTLDEAARRWLGTPWRHLGRNRAGVDCIGLILLSALECGHDIPDPAPYAREPSDNRLVQGIQEHATRVGAAAPGDVLVFRWGRLAAHVGIASVHPVYGGPSVIHAAAKYGTVCEHLMAADILAAHVATYRIRG